MTKFLESINSLSIFIKYDQLNIDGELQKG